MKYLQALLGCILVSVCTLSMQAATAIDGRWVSTKVENHDGIGVCVGAGWVVEFKPNGTFTEEIDEGFDVVEVWSGTFTVDGKKLLMHRTGFKEAWNFEAERADATLIITRIFVGQKASTVTFKLSAEPHPGLAKLPRWPKTKVEAVEILKKTMSAQNLQELASTPKKDLIGKYHFGLGMYIRNAFGIWRGNKDLWEDLTHGKPTHPDHLSGIIIEALWEDLQKSASAVPTPSPKS